MAERIVTIKIKVDDKDVDKTIASIKRLEKASGNLGGKQAGAELKQLAAGATEAGSGLTGLTAAAGPVGAALAAAAAALTIAAAAAVKVGMEVTRIAKEFADYTKEVDNASQRTGIGVEAMSALKVQIERTGGSFTDVQQIIKEFTKKIVDAADGSKKAAADLTSLGIKPKEAIANLDESFRQALKTIHDLPPGVEKSRAAIKLFGDEGFKLIPFIESFNGNLDEAIEHAKKFGLTLSNDDVLAAREFTKASKDIQDQVQGVTNTLGRELLPVVNDVFSDFNAWLGRNGAEVRAWAQTVAGSLQFVVNVLRQTLSQMKAALDLGGVLVQLAGGNTTGIAGFMARNSDAVNGFGGIWSSARARMGGSVGIPGGFGPADNPPGRGGRGGRGSGGGGGAAKLTPIQEMEKRLREGQAAFNLLSGSEYAQQLTVETAKINEQKSKLEELLKLRDKLEVNKGFAIPKTLEGLNAEIDAIRDNEKGLETAKDMLKEFQDQLAGIGDETTNLEKVNNLLADPDRNVLIDEATAALLRQKAAMLDAKDAAEKYKSAAQEIFNSAYAEQSGVGVNIEALQKEISLGRDLTETERRRIEMKQEMIDLEVKLQEKGLSEAARDGLRKDLETQQAITLEMYKQLEALQKKREVQAAAQAMQESLEDEIMMLSRGGRELTRYERLLQAIARGTTTWEEATQKNLVVLAQQADALEELNRKHAELKAFFADNLRYVFEGDFEGLFENLRRNVIDRFTDKLSDWFATSILGFDPDSNAPIVGPVVDKLGDTNKILERIAAAVGVKPGMSLPGIPNVFGGGFGGGMSGGGNTPPFNPGYFGGGGSGGWRSIFGDRTGSITQLPNGEDAITTDGRSMWEKLTGKGGPLSVFGPRENVLTGQTSKLGGILGGAGDIASMIGGMIGGRVGGIISAIGAGASMGAMFGPWGAAIGAGIGAIFGFLQGDPKRKEDKNVNIPNLNKGFTEAFKRLNDVLTGVRQMTIDPDEAISRANEIRGEIAGGFGIEFKSKKYRKEAQKMIQAKLGQADSIIDQIKAAAEISRGAADRSKRILPEFAGGSYFADYFRPNGLLPGSFDGADNILAMISRGEMVINPMQQNRVRALAGFDVFAGAGIPNYPRASSTAKLAAGGIAGAGLSPASAPVVNVQPVIHLEGVTFNEGAKAWIEGDNGKRTLVSVIADLRQKRKI